MRTLALAATGLLAAGLITAAPTHAAGETCQGQAATVVGAPGQVGLTGTEGPDVIVTNGALSTRALGGADLVCFSGGESSGGTWLDAGAGDDVVDASAAGSSVRVELGAGSDTYTGTAKDEDVRGGTLDPATYATHDVERDVITTVAGGSDRVTSGSDRTVINTDVVVLGGGGFLSWTGPLGAGGRLDGGAAGGSTLAFTVGSGDVVVNAEAGTLSQDATQLEWTGFDRFTTGGGSSRTPSSFRFLGTDRDEELTYDFPHAHRTVQHIDMGGGDDSLWLGDDNVGPAGSTYDGGSGTDHVAMWAGRILDLDLATDRLVTRHKGRTRRSSLTGFDTQLVGARHLVLAGTRKAEDLRFHACTATVRGRGGADDIRHSRDNYFEGGLRCTPLAFRLYGGGGNDVLQGGRGDDLLVGGAGRDTVLGNVGRDRCSGEKVRACEVRLR